MLNKNNIQEYLEHRLELSMDLKHYLICSEMEEVKIIEKEIEKLDLIINNKSN